MEGWIKLYRSSLDHWLYIEKRPLTRREAWEDMLMLCNHEDDKALIHGSLFECKRGQSLLSIQSWADHFRWTRQQVRTFFSLLKSDNMINIEGIRKTTRLTICNYGRYQDLTTSRQPADNQQTTSRQPADNQQTTTNKKNKNIKKEKNGKNTKAISLAFVAPSFFPAWERWVEFKKKIGKPYKTPEGMQTKYNALVKLSGDNPDLAMQIVNQSIGEEWAGLFPLKNIDVTSHIPGEDPLKKMIRGTTDAIKKLETQKK